MDLTPDEQSQGYLSFQNEVVDPNANGGAGGVVRRYTTGLGAWAGATVDGAGHQVTTDAILVGYVSGGSASNIAITIKTDSASTPTTVRFLTNVSNATPNATWCVPVKKNDYYLISVIGGAPTTNAYIIPIS